MISSKPIKLRIVRNELAIGIVAFLVAFYSQIKAFIYPYVIKADSFIHIYWMQQFQNPTLFKNDLLTLFAKNYQPFGIIGLYKITSYLVDVILFSKLLTIILFIISSVFIYRLLLKCFKPFTALFGALIFIFNPIFLRQHVGGFSRGFMYPLLLAFLYFLIGKKYLMVALTLVMQSLFYPMSFLISFFTFSFDLFFAKSKRATICYLIASLLSFSILGTKYIFSSNPLLGKLVTRQEMIGKPEYYDQGRFKVLPTDSIFAKISQNILDFAPGYLKQFPLAIAILAILFALTFFYLYFKRKIKIPQQIWLFIFSSIFLFYISDALLVRLFLPQRYLDYSLKIVILIIITSLVDYFLKFKFKYKKQFKLALLLPVFFLLPYQKDNNLSDFSDKARLYQYLETLPENILIAAHPKLADGIPLFSKRKVFVNYELSNPIYTNYWSTIKKRTFDFFSAYYAEKPESIKNFCSENDIDILLVDIGDFSNNYLDKKDFYFEPFNTFVVDLTRARSQFALKDLESFNVKKEISNRYYVLECSSL